MIRRGRSFLLLAALCLLSSACSSATLVRDPKARVYIDATWESSREFFFFGLLGPRHDIYVDQICLKKTAAQISTEYTAKNVLAGIVTLGIYTPRTVKVWCVL